MIVLNAAMQKSGTVWLHNMVSDLLVASGYGHIKDFREKYRLTWFVRPNGHVPKLRFYKLAQLLIPHLLGNTFAVTTHAPPTDLVKYLISKGTIRSLYIYRDPRDVARSLFEHGEYLRREKIRSSTQFDSLHSMEDAIHMAHSLIGVWETWRNIQDAHLLTYEALRQNPYREMQKIATFLSLDPSPDVLQGIIDRYDANKQEAGSYKDLHFNRAVVGRWRDVMDEGHIELCGKLFGGDLEKMGYDQV